MIPYGKRKRSGGKIHPHNECHICGDSKIVRKSARRGTKTRDLFDLAIDDLYGDGGCDAGCECFEGLLGGWHVDDT